MSRIYVSVRQVDRWGATTGRAETPVITLTAPERETMTAQRPEVGAGVADVDASDLTVLVTGSTSGVGMETALALGRLGAEVLVHGRDRERGRAVVDDLQRAGAADATFYAADFADLQSVRDLAATVRDDHDIDVLVNNAGGYFPGAGTTHEGFEYTIAVNHLAPFLLTAELLDDVRDSEGRVVTTASAAYRGGSIDFDSFRGATGLTGWDSYAQSKLANVLFTRELGRRLDALGAGVQANCFHPGAIPGSGFARNIPGPTETLGSLLGRLPFPGVATPAAGAETAVYLAVSPEVGDTTGRYFAECAERRPSRAARDDETARDLWTVSADLCDLESAPLATDE
jgi:NAD(P)-dependent dehydrogenase (short-subunit alcohol dehydrogenase family)